MSQATTIYNERHEEYRRFVRDYCEDELARVAEQYPGDTSVFQINLSDVFRWNPEVATDIQAEPGLFQSVFHEAAVEACRAPVDLEGITVRFADDRHAQSVPDLLRGDQAGEIVTVRGQVKRTTEVVPRLTVAYIRCTNCSGVWEIPVPEHGDVPLTRCPDGDCRSKNGLVREFDESEWHYHQLVRLRQPTEESDGDAYIDVHLTKDAAGSVNSGERVDITGVLRTHFEDISDAHPEFYIDGHTVTHHQSDYETIDTDPYLDTIRAIAAGERGDPYRLLIDSIAPVITAPEASGDGLTHLDAVKLAVGLQLFGGWRREISAGNYARGDSHICLIGDPSTGKSQILDSAAKLSPRSSYASGKNATKAGITAAAVRDDFGETEWSLDAGAIVNAHKGLCCIDEIDKVGGDVVSSLHSALEKQRLEVNKAGIDATLKCETALLAAGNPEHERFIEEQANYTQLGIDPALYSRFDLVFTLTDAPDEAADRHVADHKITARTASGRVARGEQDTAENVAPAIDMGTLRAYIAHARQHVYPIIEDDAVHGELKDYHTSIRQRSDPDSPITHRKLDALLRLCEASARVRLSDEITMRDVELVKEVIGVSLGDVALKAGEFGDFAAASDGRTTQEDRYAIVRDALGGEQMPHEDLVEACLESGIDESKVAHVVEQLKHRGEVYEPRNGVYELA